MPKSFDEETLGLRKELNCLVEKCREKQRKACDSQARFLKKFSRHNLILN